MKIKYIVDKCISHYFAFIYHYLKKISNIFKLDVSNLLAHVIRWKFDNSLYGTPYIGLFDIITL